MLARHDWITPTLGGKPWLEKPALYYWQTMLAYSIFGVSDWAARLPSAVDATLMVVGVYLFLRRFRPGLSTGWRADDSLRQRRHRLRPRGFDGHAARGHVHASPCWPGMRGTKAPANVIWPCSYIFLGLAMLAKGPVAPFLAAVIVMIFAAAQRRLPAHWRTCGCRASLLVRVDRSSLVRRGAVEESGILSRLHSGAQPRRASAKIFITTPSRSGITCRSLCSDLCPGRCLSSRP